MTTFNNLLKKLEPFSKKYPKATQRIIWGMLGISSIIFVRLFLITAEIGSIGGGSGFMNMGGIPIPWFLWKWNTTIAVFGFGGVYYAYRLMKQKAVFQKQALVVFLCFIFSCVSYPLFKQLDPDLAFTFSKESDRYLESDGSVNVDKYIQTMIRFCIKPKYSCSGKGQSTFKTTQEYIKALEAFKKAGDLDHYWDIARGIDDYSLLEDIMKQYPDKTFYAYLIFNSTDEKVGHLLKKYVTDKDLLNVILFQDEKVIEMQKIVDEDPNIDRETLGRKTATEIANKIRTIPGIDEYFVQMGNYK